MVLNLAIYVTVASGLTIGESTTLNLLIATNRELHSKLIAAISVCFDDLPASRSTAEDLLGY